MTLPTKAVMREHGPVIINASDFDPDTDEEFTGDPVAWYAARNAPEGVQGAPQGTADDAAGGDKASGDETPASDPKTWLVGANGKAGKAKRHVVVDAAGKPVTAAGIDPEGYTTAPAAWQAIHGLIAAAASQS